MREQKRRGFHIADVKTQPFTRGQRSRRRRDLLFFRRTQKRDQGKKQTGGYQIGTQDVYANENRQTVGVNDPA